MGVELVPVLVEGWQQGFVLPAGTTGDVRLTYEPHGVFQAALIGGLGLVGVLLVLAGLLLVGLRRRDERVVVAASAAPPGSRVSRSAPGSAVGADIAPAALVLAVVSVPLAMGVALGAATTWLPRGRKRSSTWAVLVAAVLAAAWTFSTSSAISPPVVADVLVALAVGLACGHVLSSASVAGVPNRAWDSLRAMTSTPSGAPDGADDTDRTDATVLPRSRANSSSSRSSSSGRRCGWASS